MPIIQTTSAVEDRAVATTDQLVAELAAEVLITSGPDEPFRQPAILEAELSTSDQALRVAVIWDKWTLIPAGDRSDAIIRAYTASVPDKADRIMIAIAVTTDEAISLGLLPFKIVMARRDRDDRAAMEAAMRAEGAVVTAYGLELRLPTLEMARSTFARLAKRTSPDDWEIKTVLRPGIDDGLEGQ